MEESGNSKSKLLIIVSVGIILFGTLFAVVLSLYKAESVAIETIFAPEEAKKGAGVLSGPGSDNLRTSGA